MIAARQAILDIEMVDTERGQRCHIHLDPAVVPVLAAAAPAASGLALSGAGGCSAGYVRSRQGRRRNPAGTGGRVAQPRPLI